MLVHAGRLTNSKFVAVVGEGEQQITQVPKECIVDQYDSKHPVCIALSQSAIIKHLTNADWHPDYEQACAVLAHVLPRQEGDLDTHIRFSFVHEDRREQQEYVVPYESDSMKLLDWTPPGFRSQPAPGRLVWARCRVRESDRTFSDVLYEALVKKRASGGAVTVYFKCDDTTQTVPSSACANVYEVGDERITWKIPEDDE